MEFIPFSITYKQHKQHADTQYAGSPHIKKYIYSVSELFSVNINRPLEK